MSMGKGDTNPLVMGNRDTNPLVMGNRDTNTLVVGKGDQRFINKNYGVTTVNGTNDDRENILRIPLTPLDDDRTIFSIKDGDKQSINPAYYIFGNSVFSIMSTNPITKEIVHNSDTHSTHLEINMQTNKKKIFISSGTSGTSSPSGGAISKTTWTRVPGEDVVIDRKKRAVYTNGPEFRVRTIDARSGKYKYVKY
jgi:hypothetical protein